MLRSTLINSRDFTCLCKFTLAQAQCFNQNRIRHQAKRCLEPRYPNSRKCFRGFMTGVESVKGLRGRLERMHK